MTTDYRLEEGQTLIVTARRPCHLRVEDDGAIIYLTATNLITSKREEAARLLAEADALEKAGNRANGDLTW